MYKTMRKEYKLAEEVENGNLALDDVMDMGTSYELAFLVACRENSLAGIENFIGPKSFPPHISCLQYGLTLVTQSDARDKVTRAISQTEAKTHPGDLLENVRETQKLHFRKQRNDAHKYFMQSLRNRTKYSNYGGLNPPTFEVSKLGLPASLTRPLINFMDITLTLPQIMEIFIPRGNEWIFTHFTRLTRSARIQTFINTFIKQYENMIRSGRRVSGGIFVGAFPDEWARNYIVNLPFTNPIQSFTEPKLPLTLVELERARMTPNDVWFVFAVVYILSTRLLTSCQLKAIVELKGVSDYVLTKIIHIQYNQVIYKANHKNWMGEFRNYMQTTHARTLLSLKEDANRDIVTYEVYTILWKYPYMRRVLPTNDKVFEDACSSGHVKTALFAVDGVGDGAFKRGFDSLRTDWSSKKKNEINMQLVKNKNEIYRQLVKRFINTTDFVFIVDLHSHITLTEYLNPLIRLKDFHLYINLIKWALKKYPLEVNPLDVILNAIKRGFYPYKTIELLYKHVTPKVSVKVLIKFLILSGNTEYLRNFITSSKQEYNQNNVYNSMRNDNHEKIKLLSYALLSKSTFMYSHIMNSVRVYKYPFFNSPRDRSVLVEFIHGVSIPLMKKILWHIEMDSNFIPHERILLWFGSYGAVGSTTDMFDHDIQKQKTRTFMTLLYTAYMLGMSKKVKEYFSLKNKMTVFEVKMDLSSYIETWGGGRDTFLRVVYMMNRPHREFLGAIIKKIMKEYRENDQMRLVESIQRLVQFTPGLREDATILPMGIRLRYAFMYNDVQDISDLLNNKRVKAYDLLDYLNNEILRHHDQFPEVFKMILRRRDINKGPKFLRVIDWLSRREEREVLDLLLLHVTSLDRIRLPDNLLRSVIRNLLTKGASGKKFENIMKNEEINLHIIVEEAIRRNNAILFNMCMTHRKAPIDIYKNDGMIQLAVDVAGEEILAYFIKGGSFVGSPPRVLYKSIIRGNYILTEWFWANKKDHFYYGESASVFIAALYARELVINSVIGDAKILLAIRRNFNKFILSLVGNVDVYGKMTAFLKSEGVDKHSFPNMSTSAIRYRVHLYTSLMQKGVFSLRTNISNVIHYLFKQNLLKMLWETIIYAETTLSNKLTDDDRKLVHSTKFRLNMIRARRV